MQFDITTIEYLKDAAGQIIADYPGGALFTLEGDLGAGKTTFVQKCGELLGLEDDVTSPTYGLVNIYQNARQIVHHLDLYRLETLEEAYGIGIEELIDDCDYCFIEWPDVIEEILPKETIKLYFSLLEDGSRRLTVKTNE